MKAVSVFFRLLRFVAVATACIAAMRAEDGWAGPAGQKPTTRACGRCQISSIAIGPRASVAVAERGSLLRSKDGSEWQTVETGVSSFFRSVTYGQGEFVAVGGSYIHPSGVIITSTDGKHWKVRRSGLRAIFRGIAYGDGKFVVAGDDGLILTSKDGEDWKASRCSIRATLTSVAYGNGCFAAVGEDGICITSRDGLEWARQSTGVRAYLSSISFDGEFTASGSNIAARSTHGSLWIIEAGSANVPLALQVTVGEK